MNTFKPSDMSNERLKEMSPQQMLELYYQVEELESYYHVSFSKLARRALKVLKARLAVDPIDVEAVITAAHMAYAISHDKPARAFTNRIPELSSEARHLSRHRFLEGELMNLAASDKQHYRRLPRVIAFHREALALDPGYADAALALAHALELYADFGEWYGDDDDNSRQSYEEAKLESHQIILQALSHNPDSPDSTRLLEHLAISSWNSDTSAAVEYYRRSEAITPLYWLDLCHLSECLAKLHNWAEVADVVRTIELRKAELQRNLDFRAHEENLGLRGEPYYELLREAGRRAAEQPNDPQLLAYLLLCVRLTGAETHINLANVIKGHLETLAPGQLSPLTTRAAARLNQDLVRLQQQHLTPVTSPWSQTVTVRPTQLFLIGLNPVHNGH